MNNNAFGLIYTGEANAQLRELTFSRSVAAVPFGGRYRTIDFVLSDIVNSGISNVGLIAQRNYHSLMDHLGSGKEWDLHRKRDGLFILPPFVTKDNTGVYRGTVDAIRSVLGYVRRSSQRYVILTGSHTVYNTTFDAMLRRHIETGADVTIMYSDEKLDEMDPNEQFDDLRLTMDETGRVTDLAFNPRNSDVPHIGCDAYIMEKTLLEYLIEDASAHGDSDFMQDVLIKNAQKFRFYGWKYDGYVARLNSLGQFYKHNMNLLKQRISSARSTRSTPRSRMRCPQGTSATAARRTASSQTAVLSRAKSKTPSSSAACISAKARRSRTAFSCRRPSSARAASSTTWCSTKAATYSTAGCSPATKAIR